MLGLVLGWLGWGEVVLGLFLGFLYGAVIGIVLIAHRHRAAARTTCPFGPFLAAGHAHRDPRRATPSSTGTAAADRVATSTGCDDRRPDTPELGGAHGGILTVVLRYLTAGESHGPALTVVVEGLPAGLPITIDADRATSSPAAASASGAARACASSATTSSSSAASATAVTLGSPVSIVIHNTEWPKWQEEMSPAPGATEKPLHQPRPGHADLVGMQKYGFDDARNVLERASARETAARVAAGALAKALLAAARHRGHQPRDPDGRGAGRGRAAGPRPADLAAVDESPVRCFDPDAEAAMIAEVEAAAKVGDSLGGVVEVLGYGVPPGLGSHVHWDRKHRRPARPGAHEHPGHEGRRDRRRLRGRRPRGAARRTTRSSGTPTPSDYARGVDPRRRHRGRHDDRRACSSRASR